MEQVNFPVKFRKCLLPLVVFFASIAYAQMPDKYAETITEGDFKKLLYTYASDEFEGRYTGAKGQKKAVEFLKNFYVSHHIKAAQGDGNYFQSIRLMRYNSYEGSCRVGDKTYQLGGSIMFAQATRVPFQNREIVYVGYGVGDSYSKVDVKGKIVLVRGGVPSGTSRYISSAESKIALAKEKGAAGILVEDKEKFASLEKYIEGLNSRKISYEHDLYRNGEFLVAAINQHFLEAVYPRYARKNSPKKLKDKFSFEYKIDADDMASENVVAYIEGEEKSSEYLVISAHLDHLGVDKNGNVYNGADDDGSGTVTVLEIAEAFQKAVEDGHRPKRSIVFLNVTGEELGLWGSRYYSEHPVFPMKQTIADLNIDMIGRIDPEREGSRNYVYLIGSDMLSTDLHNISEQVNKECCQVTLDYKYNGKDDPNRFYYRSDHYNFAKHGVPVIFYFNGVHEDYHQITDTPDRINYDLLTSRARLIFHTAWRLANREQRPVVDKTE